MLSRIDTEAREANTNEVSHVSSDSLSDVVRLSVEIAEAFEPAVIKLERIAPRIEASFAMEISGDVGRIRILYTWDEASVLWFLVGPGVCEVR